MKVVSEHFETLPLFHRGGLSPISDKSAEVSPQKSPRRSRSPADSRHETQEHHSEEWRRPREHHRIGRGRDSDERTQSRDWSGRRRERTKQDHRRFDGRYGRQKKALPAPDHVVNPSKWTKYDLSNDGTEGLKESGMSDDQVNKFAAFQFLKELRERKERESGETGEEEPGEGRVVFRKPKRSKGEKAVSSPEDGDQRHEAASMDGGFGSSGVLKMPEYVVGGGEERKVQRKGRKRLQLEGEEGDLGDGNKSKTVRVKPKSCVSLSHLAEED